MLKVVPLKALIAAVLLSVCTGPCLEIACFASSGFDHEKQRTDFLDCSIGHAPPCKALLQKASRKGSSQTIRGLANILLEEWDLPANDSRLRTPRLAWAPTPNIEELKDLLPREVDWSIIIATGVVQPNGQVTNPALLRKSAYETLNTRILNAFSVALYRPAREGNKFVPCKVEFVFQLEPRGAEQR